MLERYTVQYVINGETRNESLLGWNEDDVRRTFLNRWPRAGGAVEIVSIEKAN